MDIAQSVSCPAWTKPFALVSIARKPGMTLAFRWRQKDHEFKVIYYAGRWRLACLT